LLHEVGTLLVHFSSDHNEELIVIHSAILIGVEKLKKSGDILFTDTHAKLFARLEELILSQAA